MVRLKTRAFFGQEMVKKRSSFSNAEFRMQNWELRTPGKQFYFGVQVFLGVLRVPKGCFWDTFGNLNFALRTLNGSSMGQLRASNARPRFQRATGISKTDPETRPDTSLADISYKEVAYCQLRKPDATMPIEIPLLSKTDPSIVHLFV
jgi:hypothetical protein